MAKSKSRDLLGPTGPFASRVEGFAVREGQLAVTEAVENLLASDGALLCEAGTGIGKTFAYLVPALLSGRKVVISTATKTLQNQIAHRDLPLVQRVLGTEVPVAVMKGLSNYLCRRRHKEFLLSEEAVRPHYAQPLSLLRSWVPHTEVGDFSELATLRESSPIVTQVASSSETRIGPACPYFDECFVTAMRRDAESAQIIVVNHHLFFADLAMRGPHPGRVLPDYDAVILDEAHQVEDVAALFFGLRLTRAQFERAVKESARLLSRVSRLGGPLDPGAASPAVALLAQAVDALFDVLASPPGRRVLPPRALQKELKPAVDRLGQALGDLASVMSDRARTERDDQALREGLDQTARRLSSLDEALSQIAQENAGRVTWVESIEGKVALSSTPVDLSRLLRERLFENTPAVALLSATLSTQSARDSGGFSYVRGRLGLGADARVEELTVSSPFDYANHCLLYLPRDLPAPTSPLFVEQAAERIVELIEEVDGGAFVLTTSLSSMRKLHGLLQQGLSGRLLLLQGERPKDALLSAFRSNGAAVLVATSSFWEGVDVPGQALRLVILEKLPFSVPTDPVVQARGQALEEAGKSAFAHLVLPTAALALKQGFGRLIRREDDHGIVALLDERVHSKGYGKRILRALPDAQKTSEWEEVRRFAKDWRARSIP